ncbi:MAG: oxidoreductase [Phycisphaerae bacterium]
MQKSEMSVNGVSVPVTCVNTVIVGAGAAAMNCAEQLVRFWRQKGVDDPAERLLVVTGGKKLGASRMSGSDKQTYYKMGTSPRVPDTAEDFARTLTAFGCCHGDNVMVEGVQSLRGFYNLVEAGVPFPHDPWGSFIGYKTDHDPYERATSAGPKTSRFMSECLETEIARMGVRIVDRHPVVQFLTAGEGKERRIVGMLCFDLSRVSDEDPGVALFVAENWVLAAGGPGEVYKTTVYPQGQYGIHGPAFLAGLEACNFTESQYGLASVSHDRPVSAAGARKGEPYKGFRWNVSGTYMQVVPRIYSTDVDGGDEREFLTEYFDDMSSMCTNIFLKGYQWPFDAQRITDHQSSLVDMAVHVETVVRGRRVWMDFLRNPLPAEGWKEFDIDDLGDEAREYLDATGARQRLPIERLQHMNPPAIELYAENGIDLTVEPLEIGVCAQHMNGGFAVNKWWESNIPHTFVIGEMAGTHGVKRPGGSALNAGQVGAARAAEYITSVYEADTPSLSGAEAVVAEAVANTLQWFDALASNADAAKTPDEVMADIGERMTRYGAHLRAKDGAREALDAALALDLELGQNGMKVAGGTELPKAVRTAQQCMTHVALLKAICAMFDRGAGSRGSYCILDPGGVEMHPKLTDPQTGQPFRFRPENELLRNEIVTLWYDPDAEDNFTVRIDTPRPIPDRQIAFEPAWTEYREGTIYDV